MQVLQHLDNVAHGRPFFAGNIVDIVRQCRGIQDRRDAVRDIGHVGERTLGSAISDLNGLASNDIPSPRFDPNPPMDRDGRREDSGRG